MKKRCARCERPAPLAAWTCEDCGGEVVCGPGSVVSGRWRVVRVIDVSSASRRYEVRTGEGEGLATLCVRAPASVEGSPQEQVRHVFPVTGALHPSLARALEGGVGVDGLPWVVFERPQGETLRELLARDGALDVPATAHLMAQVALALAALHEAGSFHGALDARCVRVRASPRGGPKVLVEDPVVLASAARPADRPPGAAGDLYALGAMAWECLAGRPMAEEGRRGRRVTPVPLGLLRPAPAVPAELDDFVLRLMDRNPDRQPEGAREAAARFDRWRRGAGPGRPAGAGVREANRPSGIELELREPAVAWRAAEMARLSRALDEAASGQGAVVWMEGLEGGGKTTLGHRFLDLAVERGFRAAAGRATPGRLMSAWREALGGLGVSEPGEPAPERPVEEALGRVASRGPVALFLDDFHRADAPSADVLDRMARHLAVCNWPVLVLVASRPVGGGGEGEPALHRALATVRDLGGAWGLSGMSDREIDTVVSGMSQRPLDADLRSLLRRAADGNPMVAVQLLRHLAAQGALAIAEGRVALEAGGSEAVPQGLRQVLAARLDGLRRQPGGAAAAEILDRVALLGRHATRTHLRALLDLERRADLADVLPTVLGRLVEEGYLREVSWRPEPFLVPVHAGLREALEAERQGVDAARRHLAAARVLETLAGEDADRRAADLADHYERAGFLEASIEWLRKAADRAVTEGDVPRARDLLTRAERHLARLGLAGDRRRTTLLLDLAAWEVFAGGYREAARALALVDRDCVPAAGTPLARQRLLVEASLREARRESEGARAVLERLWEEARRVGDTAMAVRARARDACLRMDLGDNRGATEALDEATQAAETAPDPRQRGLLDLVRGRLLRKTGPWAQARASLERALANLVDPRDFAERVEAMFFQAACAMDRERDLEAADLSRTGAALCEQAGFARGQAGHLANLATSLARLGRTDEAMIAARRALEIREAMGDPRGLAHVLTALADMAVGRKDWSTARDLSEKALALCLQTGYVHGERVALLNLARAWAGLGNAAEARRRLEACLLTLRRDDSLSAGVANAHLLLADLLEAAGERDAAMRHRLGAVVVFERLDLPERAEAVRRQLGGEEGAGTPA